ncbi:hypothetical protein HB662_00920 [Roseomonas frigidaquae]|uniref:Cyclodeaminase/cyclohydrolase domain-containing protein n=1 Tax=Falsiroseomonas frigidaquae TaxID=487318 RepID=A0ABX1ES25_9PROT|nr:flagellar assembly protein FliX [Falsiroseomonas frigidaquae]NKE43320.1 hypothetical protein [Falsiroseomonas frigidaquae]
MLRVAAPTAAPPASLARLRPARGDFAALLAEGLPAAGGMTSNAAVGAGALLAIQGGDGQEPRRRHRRPARDVANQALALLRELQRALLLADPGALPMARIEAAAAEAEDLAREGGEAARLCGPLALRLRVELAKREAAAGA